MLYWLGKLTVYCFLKLFFRLELSGQDVFPSTGPFILAANHPGYFDPPLLATVVRRRIWFLAKEELFRNRISRLFFQTLGAIPIKRQTNDFRAMRKALTVLKRRPLLVFPQGLVGAPWKQVHSGVGFLAKKSGVPVIVARIYGSEHAFSRRNWFFRKGTIKIVFERLEAIQPEDNRKEIAAKIMAKIKSL